MHQTSFTKIRFLRYTSAFANSKRHKASAS